jgi:hypothetical protein
MNKYEKLIEHIINDEEGKARALFHEIVVEKSRDIYESLMDEEQFGEQMGGNQVDGMMDEITQDEHGLPEDEELDIDHGEEPIDGDMGMDDEMGMDSMGSEGSIEDKVMDLEADLEALKAEFAQLMGNEHDEEHGEPDADNMGGPSDHDADNADDEDEFAMEAKDEDDEEEEESLEEAKEEDDEEDDEESMEESRNYRKSEIDLMREYVEKVSTPANSEGQEIGKGGSVAVNKRSLDQKKNDMGGTNANMTKGGMEQNPDGKQYKAPSNEYTKGQGTLKGAEKNVNQPGGNKGAQDFYNTKASAKKPEGSTTDGSVSVDKNSILKHIK